MGPTLDQWKTAAEIVQALFTAGGIVAAGVWTYRLFVRQRLGFPKAKVSHSVETIAFPKGRMLLDVRTIIENTGSALIGLGNVETWVQQVLPLSAELDTEFEERRDLVPVGKAAVPWPTLGTRTCTWEKDEAEIEPGESETIHCHFFVPDDVEVVEIYSHVPNESKGRGRRIGWTKVTLLRLREGDNRDANSEAGNSKAKSRQNR